MPKLFLILFSALVLAGCDFIPRGAGLQTEVLAVDRDAEAGAIPEFAVEEITRDNLVTFLHWPAIDAEHFRWINRVDQPNTRIITVGDTLSITIYSSEENGLLTPVGQRSVTLPTMTVSNSGSIFLPFIGDVRVSGMSPDSARDKIEQAYEGTVQSAQVLLELTEGSNRTVTLVSGVASPGNYTLPHNDFTLLDLLGLGGGVSEGLNNPQMRLERNGRLYGVSVDRLLSTPSLNTTLSGGDKVFAVEDDRTFLSLGAAGSEAVHVFPKDTVTALEALTIVGGVAEERANAQGILILRRYPVSAVTADRSGPMHPRTVFTIDLTSADGLFSADQFLIQPGDLIYVTESPLTAARSIFSLFGSLITVGNQL